MEQLYLIPTKVNNNIALTERFTLPSPQKGND